jgi:hypothetical protein
MEKITKLLLKILTGSFITTALLLLFSFISKGIDLDYGIAGLIGFYGAIFTFWLFIAHFVSFLIVAVLRMK